MKKTKQKLDSKSSVKKKHDSFIDSITANQRNGGKGQNVTVEEGKLLKLHKRL